MELHVLHRHGWSISALAREFGLNWRTARRYATAPAAPHYPARVRPAELTPAQLAHVERRLTACPALRGTVLLRELREVGYTASVASLRRRLRILRPIAMAEPLVRFETGPGIQSQGDWTDCGTWPLGDGSAALHAWVTVLGCSRMVSLRFATDKTRATTLSAIVRCIEPFIATRRTKHSDPPPTAPRGRIPQHLSRRERMTRKLRTKAGQRHYARRKVIVEPVFGQHKECRGFRRVSLRGEAPARAEWILINLVHNLGKLFSSGRGDRVLPGRGRIGPMLSGIAA